MQAIITIMLFVGMFLVVQSVYEDRLRQIESQYSSSKATNNLKMYEPAESTRSLKNNGQSPMDFTNSPSEDVFKSSFATVGDAVPMPPANGGSRAPPGPSLYS